MKQVYVFGHKNPDTDSVCSAIALAYLKSALGLDAVAKVIGPINRGTKFVLDYFHVNAPSYLNDVKIQIKDLKYLKKGYINKQSSIYDAFLFMKEKNVTALPLVDEYTKLVGYVSLHGLAKYIINNTKMELITNMDHLTKVLNAKVITCFDKEINGFVSSVTFSDDNKEKDFNLNESSIVIVGNRNKIINNAIKNKVKLIILTKGRNLSKKEIEFAKINSVNVIESNYSGYDICNKIILANYVSLMDISDNLISVDINSYYSDFLNLMKRYPYTSYPVVNSDNICLGVINTSMISDYKKKDVILVDHNSYEESIDGLEEANILEIVDHHCLGSIGTSIPISFIARPVGCTATIIYDEFRKEKIDIPKDIAGLLVSAIISDTILFTSPTTTDEDLKAADKLAKIAGINLNKYGKELFKESTSIKDMSIDELIRSDFKSYQINGKTYGIACITTADFSEIKNDIPNYVNKLNEMHETVYAGVLMFILDIFKEGSYVLYDNNMKDIVSSAFNVDNLVEGYFIKGLISRKKQILPAIIKEIEK